MNIKTKSPFKYGYKLGGMYAWRKLLVDYLDPATLVNSCITCLNFNETDETCSQPWNVGAKPARPPARTIAFGCPRYTENDEIPF